MKIRWQDTKGVLGESSVILSLRYDRGRDTPADSLVCQLALKNPWGNCASFGWRSRAGSYSTAFWINRSSGRRAAGKCCV